MHQFTDTTGRVWQLKISVGSVKRVREATSLLLPSMFDEGMKLLVLLTTDYEKLVDVLYAVCKPEADAAGVGPEQFAESLGGDSLQQAMEALVRATADFFTSPEQRTALHKMLDTLMTTDSKFRTIAAEQAAERLRTVDTEQLAQNCLDFVTSGQGSRESIQTREPLAS